MTDIFADSKIRLAQAKRHILTLKREIRGFLADYAEKTYVIETDPSDARYYLHKIKITQRPPEEIVAFTTDIIDNLRAALDLVWRNLAVAAGFVDPHTEAKFPFADNVTKFNSMLDRGFKNFSQEIIALAIRFKPYKGGDDLLWALNRICAANKHRLLTTQFVGFHKIEGEITKWGPGEVPANMRWDHRKNEIIFFRAKGKIFTDCNINVTFVISFDKSIDVVGEKPVTTTLKALVDKVENILEALEGAARVLGLIP